MYQVKLSYITHSLKKSYHIHMAQLIVNKEALDKACYGTFKKMIKLIINLVRFGYIFSVVKQTELSDLIVDQIKTATSTMLQY